MPENIGPSHFEVYSIVDGVGLDETIRVDAMGIDAEARADQLAESLRAASELQGPFEWQVFILPHYCGDSAECECAQWLADHSPYAASGNDNA